jgi:hypothetical protein
VIKAALDRPPDVVVASVDVTDCRNGYARAIATPETTNLESEQVFLRDEGGVWVIVDYGTGIECSDPASLTPEDFTACEALGLTP